MDRKKLFKALAYSIILLSLVNFAALKFHWYFSIWWFDMPMHFFGGFCVGLVMVWFLLHKEPYLSLSFNHVLVIFFGILVIGVLWEIFEIVFNNIIADNEFDILDTTSDILFDLTGGAFAMFYFFFYFSKRITQNNESKLQ